MNESENQLIPLIDADILVYRCGFAAKPGEPLAHSLANVKSTVEGILSEFPATKDQAKLFMSGSTNFRFDVATILPYKGNRDPSHKPEFYREIKEYLRDVWHAQVSDGQEADDELGIAQTEDTCIVSTDKDLLMIPGWNYNWVRRAWSEMSQIEADKFFWYQMMTGDKAVDNIPGIDKIGPVRAKRILDKHGHDLISLRKEVEAMYRTQYGDKWLSALDEVGTLLWIRREPEQKWRDYFG